MTKEQALAYWAELAGKANLPEEQKAALAAALNNETFAAGASEPLMLKADYSRSKNEVAAEKQRVEQEYATKYQQLQQWAQQYEGSVNDAKKVYADYQKYVQTYGALDGTNGNGTGNGTGNGNGLTREDFEKLLDDRLGKIANGFGTFTKSTLKASQDYFKRFGEPLDVEEFDTFLADRRKANPNVDIDTAYQAYVQPKEQQRTEARHQEALKKAREEGAREASLKFKGVPLDTGNRELSPAWDPKRHELMKGKSPQEIEDFAESEFFAGWREAAEAQTNR